MPQSPIHPFDDLPDNRYVARWLDRIAHVRRDEAWLREAMAAPTSRILLTWRGKALMIEGAEPGAVLVAAPESWWRPLTGDPVLLGTADGTTFLAAEVALDAAEDHPELAARGRFLDIRMIGPTLGDRDGALLAYAKAMTWWHATNRFCGRCGCETMPEEAGHVRRCTNPDCGTAHFPRSDPAVIVLVHDGDRIALGRKSIFPEGMHSTFAGFVEPGESLEATVRREVREECGLVVDQVHYHSSQPWPFPQSLMLGFFARVAGGVLRADEDELEEVGWFDRAFLERLDAEGRSADGRFRLPRADSIARRLIVDWLVEGPSAAGRPR